MGYNKNTWIDQAGQVRYSETTDEDNLKIFTANYEEVTELGTPVNADNMNHIENGIKDCSDRLDDLEPYIPPDFTQLATSGTINLVTNSVNHITPTGAVTFNLPSVSSDAKLNQILVQVNLSTVYSINVGTTHYFNGKSPQMSSTGLYDLIYEYDEKNDYWVCGWMRKS